MAADLVRGGTVTARPYLGSKPTQDSRKKSLVAATKALAASGSPHAVVP
jgi:hypothetical protein